MCTGKSEIRCQSKNNQFRQIKSSLLIKISPWCRCWLLFLKGRIFLLDLVRAANTSFLSHPLWFYGLGVGVKSTDCVSSSLSCFWVSQKHFKTVEDEYYLEVNLCVFTLHTCTVPHAWLHDVWMWRHGREGVEGKMKKMEREGHEEKKPLHRVCSSPWAPTCLFLKQILFFRAVLGTQKNWANANTWKQPGCSIVGKWINKLWYTQMAETLFQMLNSFHLSSPWSSWQVWPLAPHPASSYHLRSLHDSLLAHQSSEFPLFLPI